MVAELGHFISLPDRLVGIAIHAVEPFLFSEDNLVRVCIRLLGRTHSRLV